MPETVGQRSSVVTAALATNRPRVALRLPGVTAVGMRAGVLCHSQAVNPVLIAISPSRLSSRTRPQGRRSGIQWQPRQGRDASASPPPRLSRLRRQASSIRRGGWRRTGVCRPSRRPLAAPPRPHSNRAGLLDPGLRLCRNQDDILRVMPREVPGHGGVMACAMKKPDREAARLEKHWLRPVREGPGRRRQDQSAARMPAAPETSALPGISSMLRAVTLPSLTIIA